MFILNKKHRLLAGVFYTLNINNFFLKIIHAFCKIGIMDLKVISEKELLSQFRADEPDKFYQFISAFEKYVAPIMRAKGIEESMKVNEQLLFFLEKSHLVGVVGQMGNEHGFQLMKNWD